MTRGTTGRTQSKRSSERKSCICSFSNSCGVNPEQTVTLCAWSTFDVSQSETSPESLAEGTVSVYKGDDGKDQVVMQVSIELTH